MNSIITQTITKPVIVRQGHLAEKIVIVDGQAGCGKSMISAIISSFDRVELINYAFEIEYICRLFYLNKIQKDAAISMVRVFSDLKLYNTMMGRDTNFRYSDVSSVFNDPNPWRYFKRIFQKGDMTVPGRIKSEKPILSLTTHDLLSMSYPVFSALNERLLFIEVVRHPLYRLIQMTLNMENLLDNPREAQIHIESENKQFPYFAFGWEKLFNESNAVDKAIFSMQYSSNLNDTFKNNHLDPTKDKIITIPFESFVLDQWSYLKKIENLLGSKLTSKTKRIIKKQNVPRKQIGAGIPLDVYKRMGWEPPDDQLSEREELGKRRNFAIKQGASERALEVLDELGKKYESQYFKND
jgi:hypothetical protein